MSLTLFKFIQRLGAPAPIAAPIAAGDRVDVALNKLQGQINESGSNLIINGGNAATTPQQVALRIDFGVDQ